jgi:PHO85 cyclin-5
MIEVIWPLSVASQDRDSVFGGRNLIGLRTFIQEVLKRSKTSYSTLQVALYYLVLIKPCIPRVDFTHEQTEDSHALRAMQCGRRMFLAALILASKYLQDRNYSARAWSKISGLKVAEINTNEIAFVTAVNWKLHIPESRFQRWADIVFKYSTSQSSNVGSSRISWRSIIPRLTPDLDLEMTSFQKLNLGSQPDSKPTIVSSPYVEESPSSGEITPTPATIKPRALEPTPRVSRENFRFPPISPKITQLPTPIMTPQPNGFCTPAAGVKTYHRGQSMSEAMKQVCRLALERSSMETWPCPIGPNEAFQRRCPLPGRRPSYAFSSTSTISSPESMISDLGSQSSCSSRTSRSSSVCSVASSAGALPLPNKMALKANRKCATMAAVQEQAPTFSTRPSNNTWVEPRIYPGNAKESYVRGSFQENYEIDAAKVLNRLAGGNNCAPPPLYSVTNMMNSSCRKRERPCSISDATLDAEVKALLPKTLEGLKANNEETVIEDGLNANSFLLRENHRLQNNKSYNTHVRSASGSRDGVRKRTCISEAWSKGEITMSPVHIY